MADVNSSFKFTQNQLNETDMGLCVTTVADPNRIVVTNINGYLQTSDISYSELLAIVNSGFANVNNGLSVDALTVQLGGSLVKHTTIDLKGYEFKLEATDVIMPSSFRMVTNDFYNFVELKGSDGSFFAGQEGAFVKWGNDRYIGLSSSTSQPIYVHDAYGSIGLRYGGDYSANNASNPRWIPDKAYVDSVAGGTIDESNLVHKTGDEDNLSGNKTFRVGDYSLNINQFGIAASDSGGGTGASLFPNAVSASSASNEGQLNATQLQFANYSSGFYQRLRAASALTSDSLIMLPSESGTVALVPIEIAIPSTVIDFNAPQQYKDISANTTFTFSNTGAAKATQVILTNTSGATITVDFTGDVQPSGSDHTILAGASKIFSFLCSRSSIYAAIVGY